MFSQVSVCPRGGWGVCPIAYWDTPPGQTPPWADTTPWADNSLGRHLPGQTPPKQTPPWTDTPLGRHPLCRHPLCRHPHPAQCMLGCGQQAGGTHPTWMYSYLYFCWSVQTIKRLKVILIVAQLDWCSLSITMEAFTPTRYKQPKFTKSSTPLHLSRDVVDDIARYKVKNVQIQEAKPHAHWNANFKSINIC